MRKIVSFSLWGDNPKYTIGAIKNASLMKDIYPDWECKIYCDQKVPEEITNNLTSTGVKVERLNIVGDWTFATQRFKVLDEDCDVAVFRDTDSRISKREFFAVEEWLKSDKSLHIMKDHPHHNGFPILAGMWGMKKEKFNFKISSLLKIYRGFSHYHYDQIFLREYIWKYFSHDCLIHDEFCGGQKFPTARSGTEYVGKPFEFDDSPCLPQDEVYFK